MRYKKYSLCRTSLLFFLKETINMSRLHIGKIIYGAITMLYASRSGYYYKSQAIEAQRSGNLIMNFPTISDMAIESILWPISASASLGSVIYSETNKEANEEIDYDEDEMGN